MHQYQQQGPQDALAQAAQLELGQNPNALAIRWIGAERKSSLNLFCSGDLLTLLLTSWRLTSD